MSCDMTHCITSMPVSSRCMLTQFVLHHDIQDIGLQILCQPSLLFGSDGLIKDPGTGSVYMHSDESLYEVLVSHEARDMWAVYLGLQVGCRFELGC